MKHQSDDIKYKAMQLLRRLAIQDTDELHAYYLQSMVDNGLITICERHLLAIRAVTDSEVVGNIREQMLWFLGYFAKTSVRWKSLLMAEMDIGSFFEFMIREIKMNRKPGYSLSFIFLVLSKMKTLPC